MTYTEKEKEILDILDRTDFRAMTRAEVMNIASKLGDLSPEVAAEVIRQFPEFARAMGEAVSEYKEVVSTVLNCDNESYEKVCEFAENEMENNNQSRKEFYEFAYRLLDDMEKELNEAEITDEERIALISCRLDIFTAIERKDSEIREANMRVVEMMERKDRREKLSYIYESVSQPVFSFDYLFLVFLNLIIQLS